MTARRAVVLALLTTLWCYAAWQTRAVDSDRPTTPQSSSRQEPSYPDPAWTTPQPRNVEREASRRRTPATDGVGKLNWRALAECESGGNSRAVSPTGRHRGAFQFTLTSWHWVGMSGDPITHTYAQQLTAAKRLYRKQGPGAWPYCQRFLR